MGRAGNQGVPRPEAGGVLGRGAWHYSPRRAVPPAQPLQEQRAACWDA